MNQRIINRQLAQKRSIDELIRSLIDICKKLDNMTLQNYSDLKMERLHAKLVEVRDRLRDIEFSVQIQGSITKVRDRVM